MKDQVHNTLLSEAQEGNINFTNDKEADREGYHVEVENVENEMTGRPREISKEIELPSLC